MAGNLYLGNQKVCPVTIVGEPTIESLSITPSTSEQTITASGGVDGYSPISVSAVTSSIDANITAGNIKSGVSILGVSGSVIELNGSTKTITPTTSSQTVTPTSPSNGFTSVTVPAVTYSIDANITSGNIKDGVTILGVTGNVTELKGETRSESITSTAGNTFTPSSGKNGITSITVTPTNQAKTITPTTSSQSISVPSGYSGFGTLTVNAVTSSIDSNITAGNIKSGVSILGVAGSLTPLNGTTLSVTPSTSSQSLSPSSPYNGYTSVSVSAVDSSIDANIQAGNIKSGVSILGVTGTYSGGGGGSTKYGCTIDNLLGDVDANGKLQLPVDTSGDIVFSGVEDVGIYGLTYKFYNNSNLTHGASFPDLATVSGNYGCSYVFSGCTGLTSVSLPELTTVSSQSGCASMFMGCSGLTSCSLPKLTTVSGNSGCYSMFQGCTRLTSVSLPELTTVSNLFGCAYMLQSCSGLTSVSLTKLSVLTGSYAMTGFFQSCRNITDIYFNALTTTSFGSNVNQFNSMFNSGGFGTAGTSGTCTVHFPSNLSATIAGLTGYPTFGGDSAKIVLSFDLPATS